MSGAVRLIRQMLPSDMLAIERQLSQRIQLGLERIPSADEAAALLEDGEAWTVLDPADRIVACLGIRETFPGRQGVAWAILSSPIGAAHFAITRFARRRIAQSPLVRIEAIVRTDAECTWAALVGLAPCAILRRFGAASEDHFLFDRVR